MEDEDFFSIFKPRMKCHTESEFICINVFCVLSFYQVNVFDMLLILKSMALHVVHISRQKYIFRLSLQEKYLKMEAAETLITSYS